MKSDRDLLSTGEGAEDTGSDSISVYIADLLEDEEVRRMRDFVQHGNVSTLEHCMNVAKASDRLAAALGLKDLDRRALIRGAFLHDFYLYDWHEKDSGEHRLHGFYHPERARKNAVRRFHVGSKEQEIIRCHMWPLTITRIPRCREAWTVCMADKYVSLKETVFMRGQQMNT